MREREVEWEMGELMSEVDRDERGQRERKREVKREGKRGEGGGKVFNGMFGLKRCIP